MRSTLARAEIHDLQTEVHWIAACSVIGPLGSPRLVPLLLALSLVSACGPSLSGEPAWVQWFSYRQVLDMAVSPDGETVVVGSSIEDAAFTDYDDAYQSSQRPWLARIGADGTRLHDWTGHVGHAQGVAMDGDGRPYVLVAQNVEDAARCELRALGLDGQTRWSTQWDTGLYDCASDLAIAGDTVAMRHPDRVEALDLDGRPRWQQPVAELVWGSSHVEAVGDAIWHAGHTPGPDPDDPPGALAWRYDARDGRITEVSLDLGPDRWLLGFVPTDERLIAITHEGELSSGGRVFMASLTLDGERRWERELESRLPGSEGLPAWTLRTSIQPVPDGGDAWVVGGERWTVSDVWSEPSERRRMTLQRMSGGGVHEGTLHHSFQDPGAAAPDEADPAVLARNECIPSDVDVPPVFGSLLVAGTHGCRDAFLLRLEVAR
jgi:hypothetical protein